MNVTFLYNEKKSVTIKTNNIITLANGLIKLTIEPENLGKRIELFNIAIYNNIEILQDEKGVVTLYPELRKITRITNEE